MAVLSLSRVFDTTVGGGDDDDDDDDDWAFALRCRSSQVAWKLLEVYPVQMEIARKSAKLPPARITLGYAARQREVQASAKLAVDAP